MIIPINFKSDAVNDTVSDVVNNVVKQRLRDEVKLLWLKEAFA